MLTRIQRRSVWLLALLLTAPLSVASPIPLGPAQDVHVQAFPSNFDEIMAAARYVASAMNSESFLRSLCERKNTSDVAYYSRSKSTSSSDGPSNPLASTYIACDLGTSVCPTFRDWAIWSLDDAMYDF